MSDLVGKPPKTGFVMRWLNYAIERDIFLNNSNQTVSVLNESFDATLFILSFLTYAGSEHTVQAWQV